jgi:hypothetical protein
VPHGDGARDYGKDMAKKSLAEKWRHRLPCRQFFAAVFFALKFLNAPEKVFLATAWGIVEGDPPETPGLRSMERSRGLGMPGHFEDR